MSTARTLAENQGRDAAKACATSEIALDDDPAWIDRRTGSEPRWWARQDSNLQPDRYERPALTIELQAPPRGGSRERAGGNGARFVYRDGGGGAMLARADQNAGASRPLIFEYPKFPIVHLCSCFARRVNWCFGRKIPFDFVTP